MKLTLLLMLLAGPAFAGGGSFFGPGGDSATSTGTHTDGASASFKNVTAETLTSTGTAPSLTATGANVNGQLKVSSAPIITDGSAGEVIIDRSQASDAAGSGHAIKIIGNGGGAYTTLGLFKGASAMGYFGYGNSGSILTGAGAASLSLRAENNLHLGAGGNNLIATLSGGNLGIGTASPNAKIDVVGSAMFGSGGTQSTFTANGFFQPYSRTTLQLSLLAPSAVGQYIDNSTLGALCRSTGTSAGNWALATAAGTGCF